MNSRALPWTNDVETVRQLIDWAAANHKDDDCYKYYRNGEIFSKSYIDVKNNSYAAARYIRTINPDRMHVALIAKTTYEYLMSFYGVFISNNVAVPMSSDAPAEDNAYLVNDADIELVFYDESYDSRIEELKKLCPKVKYYIKITQELLDDIYTKYDDNSKYASLSDVAIDPDDCTVIIYTSGTTGARKGAMHSSRSLLSNIYYYEEEFDTGKTTLNVLPIYHIFCFSSDFLKNMKDRVTVCLNEDIRYLQENLLRFRPHFMRMVPMIIESLLRKTRIIRRNNPDMEPRKAAEQVFGDRYERIVAGGAPLSGKIAQEFAEMGIMVRSGYGMTETGPRLSVPQPDTCGSSVGRILSTCKARIRGGELQVKTPSLFMGYYKRPEETEKVFTEDGWLMTGDMARITDTDELFITGRLKNIIILSNGENVSPEEIEKKYADEPMVKEMVVFGEGNSIVAEIYPDYDFAKKSNINDIMGYLERAVARVNAESTAAKEIDKIVLRDEPFTRTSSGKIIRPQKSA